MEQELSILIADLSGYTALTEAHGSVIAADLIDKYIEFVTEALVGESYMHERVGDEVMIISTSAKYSKTALDYPASSAEKMEWIFFITQLFYPWLWRNILPK